MFEAICRANGQDSVVLYAASVKYYLCSFYISPYRLVIEAFREESPKVGERRTVLYSTYIVQRRISDI